MSARPSLDSPRAKLDRAYEHLESLDPEIAAFFATNPYEFVPEFEAKTGEHVLRLRIREHPPLRLGTIVGDFATNTRAALDHLVYQLVLLNGKKPTPNTAFPIYRTEPEVAGDIEKRLRRVHPRHRALIEQAQPYAAGDASERHVLALLSWLVNRDKHRVVHATYGYAQTPDALYFTFKTSGGVMVPSRYEHIAISKGCRAVEGAELARIKLPDPDLQVEMHGHVTMDIAFGENWMKGSALTQIYKWVWDFVELFAPEFP
jgi:hypothetical protein